MFQVRQYDINEQLHWLWEDEHLPDTVDEVDSRGSALRCRVKAPEVYLHAEYPSQNGQRLLLELLLDAGSLKTAGGRIYDIARWRVSFRAAVAHEEVSHDRIRRHRRIPHDVRARLLAHPEERFGIWHLYITLAQGGVRGNIDAARSTLPALGAEDLDRFAGLLEQHLRKHAGPEHGMHLGFTPTLKPRFVDEAPGGENWFRPTLVDHSITFEGTGNEDRSTLNYMMMTRKRPRPTGAGAGVIRAAGQHFTHSRMRLAQSFFMEDTLVWRVHSEFPDTQLQRRNDHRIQWYWRIERHSRNHENSPLGCPPGHVWPGYAWEAPTRFVQARTTSHGTYGHSAEVWFYSVTERILVTDCPRADTRVGMTVHGEVYLYITVVNGQLRIHPEREKVERTLHEGTRHWYADCAKYYGRHFNGCVRGSAEKELLAVRAGIDGLKTAWTSLGVHVLPGAKHFFFKNAGAPMVEGFVNLAMEISYRTTATDEE